MTRTWTIAPGWNRAGTRDVDCGTDGHRLHLVGPLRSVNLKDRLHLGVHVDHRAGLWHGEEAGRHRPRSAP